MLKLLNFKTINIVVISLLTEMADLKDAYIAALEKKLAELSGIELNQIKKNQVKFLVSMY